MFSHSEKRIVWELKKRQVFSKILLLLTNCIFPLFSGNLGVQGTYESLMGTEKEGKLFPRFVWSINS